MASASTDLSWLPSDTDEQFALAFRIISNAYKNKVNSLDIEIRSLKSQMSEKSEQVGALQKKMSGLEVQLIETSQRGNQLVEENKQLVGTIKKLQKDISRLESLKKAVLTSIQENPTDDHEPHKLYSNEDFLQTAAPRTMQELHNGEETGISYMSKFQNTGGEGLFFNSPVTASNQLQSISGDGRIVDGKAFFRNARSRLSYENFNAFLANIKKLNNHLQSREETLIGAQQLFGEANADLFEDFKLLLVRHS